MVVLKLVILVFFIIVGAFYVKPANWQPFAPNGWAGIGSGAALIFFAYIGFDAVSTAAEECRNPQKDMPIGMIGSLAICTVLYVATSLVLTGMVPLAEIKGSAEPLAKAFSLLGMNWAAGIVAFGAVIATTAVLLVFQYGQARIFFSMARDGLLPAVVLAGPPAVQDAARHHDLDRGRGGPAVGLRQPRRVHRADEHRHALRVHPRLHRHPRPAADGPASPARLPHAVRAVRPARRHRDLPLPDRGIPVVPLDSRGSRVRPLRRAFRATRGCASSLWLVLGLVIYFLYGFRKSRLAKVAALDSGFTCYTPKVPAGASGAAAAFRFVDRRWE